MIQITKDNIQDTWAGPGCLRMGSGDNIVITNSPDLFAINVYSLAVDFRRQNPQGNVREFIDSINDRLKKYE
jgi:hypothetical protein